MTSSWQIKEGRLVRRWSGRMERTEYQSPWMETSVGIQSGYLPLTPDFASRSPFGGASWFWFLPDNYRRLEQQCR